MSKKSQTEKTPEGFFFILFSALFLSLPGWKNYISSTMSMLQTRLTFPKDLFSSFFRKSGEHYSRKKIINSWEKQDITVIVRTCSLTFLFVMVNDICILESLKSCVLLSESQQMYMPSTSRLSCFHIPGHMAWACAAMPCDIGLTALRVSAVFIRKQLNKSWYKRRKMEHTFSPVASLCTSK